MSLVLRIAEFVLGTCFSCAVRKTDDLKQIRRKRVLIILSLLMLPIGVAMLMRRTNIPYLVCGLINVTVSVSTLIPVLGFKQTIRDNHLALFAFSCFIFVILLDTSSISLGQGRRWTLLILISDVLLICGASEPCVRVMVLAAIIWLVITTVELGTRVGLIDFVNFDSSPQDRRSSFKVDCDNLPCPVPAEPLLFSLLYQLVVFGVDVGITRGFAHRILLERQQLLASISIAREIATSLSKFDLQLAGKLLNQATIPDDMRIAFTDILSNLESYQPYLPRSCIPDDDGSNSDEGSTISYSTLSDPGSPDRKELTTSHIRIQKVFQMTNVSILIVNIRNSSSVFEHSIHSFEKLVNILVSTTFDIVVNCKGTPDVFMGDRMIANFNGSRRCATHQLSCLEAATQTIKGATDMLAPFQEQSQKLSVNLSTTSGAAAAGDLGCERMMRFSLIGVTSQLSSVFERAGALLNIPLVCNFNFFKEVNTVAECILVLQQLQYTAEIHMMFEVRPRLQLDTAEWMYQVQESGAGKWDSFNALGIALMGGNPVPRAFEGRLGEPQFRELRTLLDTGIPAPLVFNKR